jgi:CBS domain-containing protein
MARDTPVRDVMTTDVVSVSPDATVEAAMRSLVEQNVDAAPVVDAGGHVVGLLSSGDLIVQDTQLHLPTVISILGATITLPGKQRQFEDDLRKALGASVSEVMSTDPVTCSEDDTIEQVATVMHDNDISRLPVVRDGVLVGIVGRTDILRAILAED